MEERQTRFPYSFTGCRPLMLMVMAGLTLATGAKTRIIPIKVCPVIKALAAVLLYLGSMS